jgi:hypothetical protein
MKKNSAHKKDRTPAIFKVEILQQYYLHLRMRMQAVKNDARGAKKSHSARLRLKHIFVLSARRITSKNEADQASMRLSVENAMKTAQSVKSTVTAMWSKPQS